MDSLSSTRRGGAWQEQRGSSQRQRFRCPTWCGVNDERFKPHGGSSVSSAVPSPASCCRLIDAQNIRQKLYTPCSGDSDGYWLQTPSSEYRRIFEQMFVISSTERSHHNHASVDSMSRYFDVEGLNSVYVNRSMSICFSTFDVDSTFYRRVISGLGYY